MSEVDTKLHELIENFPPSASRAGGGGGHILSLSILRSASRSHWTDCRSGEFRKSADVLFAQGTAQKNCNLREEARLGRSDVSLDGSPSSAAVLTPGKPRSSP